jgi:replication-associated recombination protein RarA
MSPGSRYALDEVKSALQKSIRRGLEEDALYWAARLEEMNDGANILWRRLRVIASEDVGLADSNAAVQIHALHEQWERSRNSPDMTEDTNLFVVHAVLLLARAPKSRIVDSACHAIYEQASDGRPVPDYALDQHTERGRKLGRGTEHFFEEAAKLANQTLEDPYEERSKRFRL